MRRQEFDENHSLYRSVMANMELHAVSRPAPPKKWLAPGFLAAGELSAFFGEPGATKSVLAIDIACRLASCLNWDGEEAEYRFGVLYIAAERAPQVRRRVDAFVSAHGIGKLQDLTIYSGPIDLAERSDHLSAIIEGAHLNAQKAYGAGHIESEPGDRIDLVVIDTLAAAMSRPDSDTDATAAAAENLTRAARETGAHICIVHHQPLSGEVRLRGGHLTAAMDLIVNVKKTKAGSVAQVIKDNGSSDANRLRLDYSLKSVDVACSDGSVVREPVVVPGKAQVAPKATVAPILSRTRQEALDALRAAISERSGAPATELDWRTAYSSAAPSTDKPSAIKVRFYRQRDWLEQNGLVERVGETWMIPAQEQEQPKEHE